MNVGSVNSRIGNWLGNIASIAVVHQVVAVPVLESNLFGDRVDRLIELVGDGVCDILNNALEPAGDVVSNVRAVDEALAEAGSVQGDNVVVLIVGEV